MEKMSHFLRQERERQGLSLQAIERELHIPLHYLELLEGSGDRRFLADPTYLIPPLRTYAAFLHLDQGDAISRFTIEIQKSQQTREKAENVTPLPRLLTRVPQRAPTWLRTAIVVLFLRLLALIGQYSEMDVRWQWSPKGQISPLPSVPATPSAQEPPSLVPASPSGFSASFPDLGLSEAQARPSSGTFLLEVTPQTEPLAMAMPQVAPLATMSAPPPQELSADSPHPPHASKRKKVAPNHYR